MNTTTAPPTGTPPWTQPAAPAHPLPDPPTPDVDDEDLATLDEDNDDEEEEDVEIELEEPVENHVSPGANQLSMKIASGREKPTQSTLKVRSRSREFGTTREWNLGDRVPFTGMIEIKKIDVEVKKNGRIVRTQHAVIAECDILDEDA